MVQSNENMSKIYDKGNARSKQKIALSFLGKIIKDHKIYILDAFEKEGILLDRNISDKRLIFEIKKTLMQDNQQAKNLKTSLAILILAKKDNFSDFFNAKPQKVKAPKTTKVKAPKGVKEPKVKDGNFFTRLFKKDEITGTSKAGDIYRNNKDAIDLLGGTILSGIAQRGSQNVVSAGINNDIADNNNVDGTKKTPYLKYALIVGGIAVAGFIVYKIIKRNK
jgi:hypothetical protein